MLRMSCLLTWRAALSIAGILLRYGQYKLPGADGSLRQCTLVSDWLGINGHEKLFRLLVAIAGIIASDLVLVPTARVVGVALSLANPSGALFFHLFSSLGIGPCRDGCRQSV
jgi:hypothetical protein